MNKEKYFAIKEELDNKNVTLVAVSKTKPKEDILTAYNWGQRIFGENRARELEEKAQQLPSDIEWHMIGHLQRNKVKYIAPFVSLIHSVDKLSLLKEINKRAAQNDRIINVLLQVHIAKEENKFGFDEQEIIDFVTDINFSTFNHIKIVGVMGMATFTDNKQQIQEEFATLHDIFERLKSRHFQQSEFQWISMGMSGDYKIAIEQGSNMVRIGSLIFGARS